MKTVVSLSRSFGKLSLIGRQILQNNGFVLIFPPAEMDLNDEEKVVGFLKITNTDALIAGATKISRVIIDASEKLKIISKPGIGVDNIDINHATSKKITVTNSPNSNIESVAELTIGLMINLLRKIPESNLSMKAAKWELFLGSELYGKTIGILGTGKIGKSIIKKLNCFSVSILAYDIYEQPDIKTQKNFKYVALNDVCINSDLISIHLSLNEDTKKLFNGKLIKLMKSSAYLINTSRGAIIDEEALYMALREKRIAGAALDVWEKEPPFDISRKLSQLDNVLATPHIGAYTKEALYHMGFDCANAIVDFFNGKKPQNIINPEIWGNIKETDI